MTFGTILPTNKSGRINDWYARSVTEMKQSVAEKQGLTSFRTENDGLEIRYWKTPSLYAIVGRELPIPQGTWVIEFCLFLGKPYIDVIHVGVFQITG